MQEYVVLPDLISLKVDNYSLYSRNWDYSVQSGVNLFIGVNGLGKTTSTSLIIYGLVGETTIFNSDKEEFKFIFDKKGTEQKFKIDSKYFKNREYDGLENDIASIELEFALKTDIISIKRKLFTNEIVQFTINGQSSEMDYEAYILEKTRLSKISDLAFILEKFLIKEEEGNYLLWDIQEQSRILQLLLSPIGFKDRYQKKLNDLSKITTIEKQASYSKTKSLKQQIANFKAKKKDEENKKYNLGNLKKTNTQLGTEITELSQRREKLFNKWLDDKKEIDVLDSKIQGLSFEISEHSSQLSQLEAVFYNKVYTHEKLNTSIHKLNSYGICIYCDEYAKPEKKEFILSKLKHNCCPVCDSNLDKTELEEEAEDNPDKILLSKLSDLQVLIDRKRNTYDTLKSRRLLFKDVSLNDLTEEIDKEIESRKQKQFKLILDITSIENTKEVSYWDALIHELEEQIKVIEKETENEKKQAIGDGNLDSISTDIRSLNEELTRTVISNLENLNRIFKELSRQYFKDDGKLVTVSGLITKTNNFGEIKQEVYAPHFDKKDRTEIKELSTSERLFLEYIFRLSLLKLYEENSKNKTFMIMETSEGSFDYEHTKKLAELFSSFNTEDNSLILILNLSKEDFIKELNNYLKSDDRILKFFEFARFERDSQKIEMENKLSEWLN